jgi:hypothetical protein
VIAYALSEDEKATQDAPAHLETLSSFPQSRRTESIFILEAQNNIPALAFDNNDLSGRWLYSSCIDGQTIQWDLHKRARAVTYQMGWCASGVSSLSMPEYESHGFSCSCDDAGSVLHGAWGSMPVNTHAAYEMTLEEERTLEPKPIKPYFTDVSSHKRQFAVGKRIGPPGGSYVSTSDDELSMTGSDEEMEDAGVGVGTEWPGGASVVPTDTASLVCKHCTLQYLAIFHIS